MYLDTDYTDYTDYTVAVYKNNSVIRVIRV